MKTHIFFGLILVAIITSVFSCDQKSEGDNSRNNSIVLSANNANLSSSKDSIVITTKAKLWWVNDILVNGNYLIFNPDDTEKQNFEIHGDWFSIEKCDNQKLIVRVDANKSTCERKIKIRLETSGNIDDIDLNQLAMN